MDNKEVIFKKERIVRVLNINKHNNISYGTGFFITENDVITCSHVVLTKGLRFLEEDNEFKRTNFEEELVKKYHKSFTKKIEVELFDKSRKEVFIKHIDPKNDFVILRLSSGVVYDKFFEIDIIRDFYYNDYLSFCGFQDTPYVNPLESPFTYNDGNISSFPDLVVGGEKYQHLQINSINLGGNSGAPLFMDHDKDPVGIINGNQNWGNDNMAIFDEKGKIIKNVFRVPLSIAYATSFKLLKERSTIFKRYISKIKIS